MERLVRLREPREAAHLHRLRQREGLAGSRRDASGRARVAHAQKPRARRPARLGSAERPGGAPRDVRGGGRRAGQREEREEREERWRVAARRARRAGPHGRGGGAWRDAARRDLMEGNSGGCREKRLCGDASHTRVFETGAKTPACAALSRIGIRRITVCHLDGASRVGLALSRDERRKRDGSRRLCAPTPPHTSRVRPPRLESLSFGRPRATDRVRAARAAIDPSLAARLVSSPSRPRIVVLTAPTRLARPQTHAPIAFRATESQSWPRCCRPAPRSRPARVS